MIETFTIEAATKSGTVIFTTGTGEKAILIFSGWEKCQSFIDGYHSGGLRLLELTSETIVPWTLNVRLHGATHAILDPTPRGNIKTTVNAKLETMLSTALGNNEKRQASR
jgi:hypothetical protein